MQAFIIQVENKATHEKTVYDWAGSRMQDAQQLITEVFKNDKPEAVSSISYEGTENLYSIHVINIVP